MWHSPYELPEDGDRILVRYSNDDTLNGCDIFIYDTEKGIGLDWDFDVDEWKLTEDVYEEFNQLKEAELRFNKHKN